MTATVPQDYQKFHKIFKEKMELDTLLEYALWDYKIPIQKGKQPKFGPIYQMLKVKLEALSEFLEKNLKKGYL